MPSLVTVEQATAEGWYLPNTNGGYCMCACGELAPISPKTDRSRGYVQGQRRHFIMGHHGRGRPSYVRTPEIRAKISGPNNWNWKGGRYRKHDGYVLILSTRDHPMADKQGYIREHRVVMAAALGRPLTKKEVVHHRNGVRDDNRLENLMLFATHSDHVAYEYAAHYADEDPSTFAALVDAATPRRRRQHRPFRLATA